MDFIISASTDVGLTKKVNQDSFSVKVIDTAIGKIAFAIICDGMGGFSNGEIASSTLVMAFDNWINHRLPLLLTQELTDTVIRSEWENIITKYNQKIIEFGKNNGIKIGTTISVLLITQSRYYILNVGDSRTYLIKDDVYQLTKDHTLVAREIVQGKLTEEQAKTDSRRSVLLQCVGVVNNISPDMFFGVPKINDVFLLCSDGFIHEITKDELFQHFNTNVLSDSVNINSNINRLIDLNKERKERDNISAVVVKIT